MNLRPFQKTFIKRALDPAVDTAALSIPRGNGKTTLAGLMVANALNPDHADYAGDGAEVVLFAGSIEQCRLVYRQALGFLPDPDAYRLVDSATRVAITHKRRRTRLKAIGSNPKTSLGLVGVPLVVLDEPGALHTIGGGALWDSIATAQGKPGSRLKAVLIGTIAPAAPGSWWPELVDAGSQRSTYVQALRGRVDEEDDLWWSKWPEIARVNPLARVDAGFRAKLLEERDGALKDSRLKARFLSYRLNSPTADESEVLLTVQDWRAVCRREVEAADGRPLVGVDLGGGRAWSAAVAGWRSGRIEAVAVAPGTPSLEAQEKRDRVPAGTYVRLADAGVLVTDGDRRVPRPEALLDLVRPWRPERIICDRFRYDELKDAAGRLPIMPRVSRWSEAAEDIRALRKMALDGPLSVGPESRALIQASLAVSKVKNDDQGSFRLTKRDPRHNTARDDVAAALVLVAGAMSRRPKPRPSYLGLVA